MIPAVLPPTRTEFDTFTVGANQTCAIITWTNAGPLCWMLVLHYLDADSGLAWSLRCRPAEWELCLRLCTGQGSPETTGTDKWQFGATATDGALVVLAQMLHLAPPCSSTPKYQRLKYRLGHSPRRAGFCDSDPVPSGPWTFTVIANGGYKLNVKSAAATWGGSSTLATDGTPDAATSCHQGRR